MNFCNKKNIFSKVFKKVVDECSMSEYNSFLGLNKISLTTFSNVDSEHSKIIKKLISLGITPSGNKVDDKSRLHRFELEKVEDELKSITSETVNSTQFVTISNHEIEQLRQKLNPKNKNKDEDLEEQKKMVEERIGEDQIAKVNSFFIKKNSKII